MSNMLNRLSAVLLILNAIWAHEILKVHLGNDRIELESVELTIYTQEAVIAEQWAADKRLIRLLKDQVRYDFRKTGAVQWK